MYIVSSQEFVAHFKFYGRLHYALSCLYETEYINAALHYHLLSAAKGTALGLHGRCFYCAATVPICDCVSTALVIMRAVGTPQGNHTTRSIVC